MGTLLVMKARPSCQAPELESEHRRVNRLGRLLRWIEVRRKAAILALVFWAIYGYVIAAWLTR